MNDVKKRYFGEIKRQLPCNAKEKNRCIMDLEGDVDDFLENCPGATYEDLCTEVGNPQTIAKSFLERIDPKQLSHRVSAKRKIAIGVIVVVALLAIVVGVSFIVTAYMRHDFYDGYYVDTVDKIPSDAEPIPSPLEVH